MVTRFLIPVLGMVLWLVGASAPAVAQGGYSIKPGDTLLIEVLEDPSLNRSVLVLPDGSINFPLAGTVAAKGRSTDQVRQSLSSALAQNFASTPNVYVSVAALAQPKPRASSSAQTIDIYAVGELGTPGLLSVKPGITILQFLAAAGGLTKFAAEKRIELHRTDRDTGTVTTYLFNFQTPAGGSSGISGGTRLTSGDVVKVPQRRLFE